MINSEKIINGEKPISFPDNKVILEYKSPTLDKIVYWFLKKSVNLLGNFRENNGERKNGNPSFKSGMKYLKSFWKDKGIDERMINFVDGSGLSPQNYASAKAEVQALLWAKNNHGFRLIMMVFGNGKRMKMKVEA
jgi:D-alanyl-D-alanine carboxypeptidase/D-alanyl-D-alanine-endopeptidase (penicillin-binding protein 4)